MTSARNPTLCTTNNGSVSMPMETKKKLAKMSRSGTTSANAW